MELTEKERLMLVGKKEEIRRLTEEIIELVNNHKNSLEIKKKITAVQSLLSDIASYANSKNYRLDGFTEFANILFTMLQNVPEEVFSETKRIDPNIWNYVVLGVGKYCNYANSVRFNFTKRDVKIHLPKIDLSIFRIDLQSAK